MFEGEVLFRPDVHIVLSNAVADWIRNYLDRTFIDLIDFFFDPLSELSKMRDISYSPMVHYNAYSCQNVMSTDLAPNCQYVIERSTDKARKNVSQSQFVDLYHEESCPKVEITMSLRHLMLYNFTGTIKRAITRIILPTNRKLKTERKHISQTLKNRIAAEQHYQCNICRTVLPSNWNCDHIVPLWRGGSNERPNLQILCVQCHDQKTRHENACRYVNKSPYFTS